MDNGLEERVAGFEYWRADDAASRLQKRVRSGECIAFIGSGPSASAGYPSWVKLVEELCSETGVGESSVSFAKERPETAGGPRVLTATQQPSETAGR